MLPGGHATSVEGPVSSLLICICVRVYVWLSLFCSLLDLFTYPSCGHGRVRKQPSLGLIASLVYVYVTAKWCSISRSSIRGWRFVCLLIKTGTLKSLDFSVKSFVSPVYLFVFVAGRVVEGENGNLQSDQFPLVFTVTMFFSSCRLMRFLNFFVCFLLFLYPQVLSPPHRLKSYTHYLFSTCHSVTLYPTCLNSLVT